MQNLKEHFNFLKQKGIELRIDLLKMIAQAEAGHTGSCLSALDMMIALYYGLNHDQPFLKCDPQKPGSEQQDYFVLSKMQAAPAWYVILADLGFFSKDEFHYYTQQNALLSTNPHLKIPGVTLPAGSLGESLSYAVGLAQALKMDRARNKVFVMVGDAELMEGQTWEAVMLAAHYKLDNLILLIDRNGIQVEGIVRNVMAMEPIAEKFDAFGWRSINVFNGHDFDQLSWAYEKALSVQRMPTAIVCKTVKAKGVSFAEGKSFYHNMPLSQEELEEAVSKLEAQLDFEKASKGF
jgi:transketolase